VLQFGRAAAAHQLLHHEIATAAAADGLSLPEHLSGRKIAALQKTTGSDPMQSKAQIDQLLRARTTSARSKWAR